MHRVLRPGGIGFVRVAAYNWMRSSHDEALGTQRRYSLGKLRKKLQFVGFDIVRATYANSFLLPAAAIRRLVLKRIGLAEKGSDVKPLPKNLSWVNRILNKCLIAEARILSNPRRSLPAGLSVICVLRKPSFAEPRTK